MRDDTTIIVMKKNIKVCEQYNERYSNEPSFALKYTMSKTDVISWREIYKGLVETNSNILFTDEEDAKLIMSLFCVNEDHILVIEDENTGELYYRILRSEEYVLSH